MTVVTQDIKISCQNSIIKGAGAKSNDGHPWRNWQITLCAMEDGKEVKGKLSIILDHVEYILHPTFEDPRRVKYEEPYLLQEKGWGEFDLRVVLYFTDDITDPQVLLFDLNFAMSNYEFTHTVKFPNASPELKKLLAKEPYTASPPLGPRKGGKKPMSASLDQPHTAKKKPKSHEKDIELPAVSPLPRSPGYNDSSTPPSSPYFKSSSGESIGSPSPPPQYNNRIMDHVNNLNDVYNMDPIHRADIPDHIRERWDIPNINMWELLKRFYRLSTEQKIEFQKIICEYKHDGMDISSTEDGGLTIDFYTLGRPCLEKLWDYVADMGTDDDQSFASQDFHQSDLEFNSDTEEPIVNYDTEVPIVEYDTDTNNDMNVDDDTYYNGDYSMSEDVDNNSYDGQYSYEEYANGVNNGTQHSYNYDSDVNEPGFQNSDIASEGTPDHHHGSTNGYPTNHITNGYHEASDMEAQDDDDNYY